MSIVITKTEKKKLYAKKLVITGDLDCIKSPADLKSVAILGYHILDDDGNIIGQSRIEEKLQLNISQDDLINLAPMIEYIGEMIDNQYGVEGVYDG